MSICSCLYPLHIVDKRDGGEKDPIEYLAFPQEVIDELGIDGKFKIPRIKAVKEAGLDGIVRDYVKVIWANSTNAKTKKYDVNDHVIVVGCDLPVSCRIGIDKNGKGKAGNRSHKDSDRASARELLRSTCNSHKCEEKEVYEVLHPLDEWHSHHIVEI